MYIENTRVYTSIRKRGLRKDHRKPRNEPLYLDLSSLRTRVWIRTLYLKISRIPLNIEIKNQNYGIL